MNNRGVWASGYDKQKNVTLNFVKSFDSEVSGKLQIAGHTVYQIYNGDKLIAFGPDRTAHGYNKIQTFNIENCTKLTIVIASYLVPSFCYVKSPPFLLVDLYVDKHYTEWDFDCYKNHTRLQKVQRYSYQRGFSEIYNLNKFHNSFIEASGEKLILENANMGELSHSNTANAKMQSVTASEIIENGNVTIDDSMEVWRDRAHTTIGTQLEGFEIAEWQESSTDEASKFLYSQEGKPCLNSDLKYVVFDFKKVLTGFIGLKIKAPKNAKIYAIYDEIIWDEENNKNYNQEKNISFYRNTCSNVIKWTVCEGEFDLLSFEPYSLRYLKIVADSDVEIKQAKVITYHNGEISFKAKINDEKLQAIMDSAINTLEQNAVDFLMDCPSRERAGWLSDSYFSSDAERLFCGSNKAEQAFLDNYAKSIKNNLPQGMIHMVYPADNIGGEYIPNWAMWYILEVHKYYKTHKDKAVIESAKSNILGIMDFFKGYENEYGLLEDLESWVFVEWSDANSKEHIAGVNYPSNMAYSKCLEAVSELYEEMSSLKLRAENLKKAIIDNGFDGEFFVDNSIRQNGKLVKTSNYTEVCQYYALWFDICEDQRFDKLKAELDANFGAFRKQGYMSQIKKPNAMYGIYMRLDMFYRNGQIEKLKSELVDYFYKMAVRTGTLWENNDPCASCDHGFASYVAIWIVYLLTGYKKDGSLDDKFIGYDCEIEFPPQYNLTIKVKEGKRQIIKIK